ncbi:tryptophan synthase beta subunit-like PLP-dependent enzyme [Gonapodya prolifera JEL478]|uniref:Cysteine synthase 1 n=1 Tax=Gonapodya prolifera (strain JEL478) TaxID=1344416 RepID=A0A139AC82_GONPJ|nr:tryptophan synthase beta subunit-like PLP-dependent enzyme [Gonapodya prolifera JEL478]|eukprot:KXS14348.1 tryptophan synthase beta subunit-like PLP-dependent enzyme [Gonapodya prolifera JEL478]
MFATRPFLTSLYGSVPSSLRIAGGLTEAIGNAPLIRLNRLSEETGCEILGRADFMQPGEQLIAFKKGPVKDRAALYLVKDAEERGPVKPGGVRTAGNTGIGLSHVCRSRGGYKCVIYVPNTQSQENIDLLKMLGADVHPVPAVAYEDPANYSHQARDFAERTENAVWTAQFVWDQTSGKVDAFTCATGTGGTRFGVAHSLKSLNSSVKIYLADPPGSVVTDNLRPALEAKEVDGALKMEDEATIEMVFGLLDEEGLFLVVAAYRVSKMLGPGKTVVPVLCDGAGRYLSRLFSKTWLETKGLYRSVPEHLRKYVSLEKRDSEMN